MSAVEHESSYFLPSEYSDHRVTLLARDPHWLFAYWEIADEIKNSFLDDLGSELWERSVPVLKVVNVSKNTDHYIRINDFSNNWYVNVPDANCLYVAEIGRKVSDRFFINLASSNYTVTPGDHVSSNNAVYFINYKDLKSGTLDLDSKNIYEMQDFRWQFQGISGLSSPELSNFNLGESVTHISSAELFGINLPEHFGISSEFWSR